MEASCEQLSETRAPTRHCGHVTQFPCSCRADTIKDSNYNVHKRMLVCTYVRGCVWFLKFLLRYVQTLKFLRATMSLQMHLSLMLMPSQRRQQF